MARITVEDRLKQIPNRFLNWRSRHLSRAAARARPYAEDRKPRQADVVARNRCRPGGVEMLKKVPV